MEIQSVGGVEAGASGASQRLGLSQEDFLKVLLAQLSFQDPLDPLDNKDFMAQLAQFTSLEQNRQINDKLDTMLTFNAAGQAVGLLGRTVEVRTDGGTVVGEVITSAFQQGVPFLTVRTAEDQFLADIRLSQVTIIR